MIKKRFENKSEVGTLSNGQRPNFAVKSKYGTRVKSFASHREAERWITKNGWSPAN